MSEIPKPETHTGQDIQQHHADVVLSEAAKIGLPENLTVLRSSGDFESGWTVERSGHTTHPETGESGIAVKAFRFKDDGRKAERAFWLTDLQTWNSPADEDTVPRAELQTRIEQAEASDATPGEQHIGESALDGAEVSVEEVDNPNTGAEEAKPEAHETAEIPPRQESALKELQEAWNIPEGDSVEVVTRKLTAALEKINSGMQGLHDFDGDRQAIVRELGQSLGDNANRFSGSGRAKLEQFVNGSAAKAIIAINDQNDRYMPPQLRAKVRMAVNNLTALRSQFNEMNARGSNFIDMNAVEPARRILCQAAPEFMRDLGLARREVEEWLTQLNGYREAVDDQEASKEISYRNDAVKQWAAELAKSDVSAERLQEIIDQMHNAVEIESTMQDDPNSPRVWFGNRVLGEAMKARKRTDITGRKTETIPSRQYVAELMADMLRGKFVDQTKVGVDDVLITSSRAAEEGQHRAAALAMIYGNEWPKLARKVGFETIKLK